MRLLVSARIAPHSETPLLAVRHAADVVEVDGVIRESFDPDCWLAGGRSATVQHGHDTEPIGSVVVLAARKGWWFADMTVDTDDPEALAQSRRFRPSKKGYPEPMSSGALDAPQ